MKNKMHSQLVFSFFSHLGIAHFHSFFFNILQKMLITEHFFTWSFSVYSSAINSANLDVIKFLLFLEHVRTFAHNQASYYFKYSKLCLLRDTLKSCLFLANLLEIQTSLLWAMAAHQMVDT